MKDQDSFPLGTLQSRAPSHCAGPALDQSLSQRVSSVGAAWLIGKWTEWHFGVHSLPIRGHLLQQTEDTKTGGGNWIIHTGPM